MALTKRTLTKDLLFGLTLVTSLVVLIIGYFLYTHFGEKAEVRLTDNSDRITKVCRMILPQPLWDMNDESIKQIGDTYIKNPSVQKFVILNADKEEIFSVIDSTIDTINLFTKSGAISHENETIGTVQITFTKQSVIEAKEEILVVTIIFFLAIVLTTIVLTTVLLKRQLQNPLKIIIDGLSQIAKGNYSNRLTPVKQMELLHIINGTNILAEEVSKREQENKEKMIIIEEQNLDLEEKRKELKKYSDHLQELVDEKTQQVKVILNNIDQGLLTIDPNEGTINKEYSARANDILHVKDVASENLASLLRLDKKQTGSLTMWLNFIKTKHQTMAWNKIVRLAPIRELQLPAPSGEPDDFNYISIDFQKIVDSENNLSNIMMLAIDETEKRRKEAEMKAEQERHNNEVALILGIVNTPAEELAEFTADTEERLNFLQDEIAKDLDGAIKQRDDHPDGKDFTITEEHINELYRDLHTIKGNAGSYGFNAMTKFAHEAETALDELRNPTERREDLLKIIDHNLNHVAKEFAILHEKIKQIFGNEEDLSMRIPKENVDAIFTLIDHIPDDSQHPEVQELLFQCRTLSWKPLKSLGRKYQKLAEKTSRQLNKKISFQFSDPFKMFPPDALLSFDEILLHIVRNAVDHGIEDNDTRDELEKGIGNVQLSFDISDNRRILTVTDDGKGINYNRIVEKCLEKELITPEEAETMSKEEKISLIFTSGISTASDVSDISGRGVGMDVVRTKVQSLGGSINVSSDIGKGTTIKVVLPEKEPAGIM